MRKDNRMFMRKILSMLLICTLVFTQFSVPVKADNAITLPILLGGTVYDCTVRLAEPVTSSGSTTLAAGGTVCFPLEFLGGDGIWYLVRANELQGMPGEQVSVLKTVAAGGELVGDGIWKTWADVYGDRYYIEYTVTNNTTADAAVDFSAALQKESTTDIAKKFTGTVSGVPITLPILLGGTVYDCTVRLAEPVTSSGSTTLAAGGTVCFPLEFLGGDGIWYLVRANELQGMPGEQVSVLKTVAAGGELVGDGIWKTWADVYGDRYYIEYTVTNNTTADAAVDFSVTLQKESITDIAKKFTGTVSAGATPTPTRITLPINIGGTVYDCVADLQGYLTSSGSDSIPSGGTVCFPLMFLGGDGKWYPVLKDELQGTPEKYLHVDQNLNKGEFTLGRATWKTWDNGHWYIEYIVSGNAKTTVDFSAQINRNGVYGIAQRFVGTLTDAATATDTTSGKNIIAPITINGVTYDCIVDFQGYLTSSGSDSIPSGGTVCFPLMFLGGDGNWYPVLANELQGTPDKLFRVTYKASLGDCTLIDGQWKTWDNGHYFMEYKIAGQDKKQDISLSVTLHQGDLAGNVQTFAGTVAAMVPIPQIPFRSSASLIIKRLEECKKFNTLSFTISDVRYDEQWPVDFETPKTSDAILMDGSIIKADLCFMVNNQWYPVRNNEVNENVEELLNYEFVILEGEECLGTPRLTTRLDTYGDIWQFEVPVKYAGENSDFRFTICLLSADGTKIGSVYEVSGTVQDENREFIVTTETDAPVNKTFPVLPIVIGGAVAVLISTMVIITIIVTKRNKRKNDIEKF